MERTTSPDSPVSLTEIRALAAERAWQRLAEYVAPVEGNDWTDQPEVLFHYADALWRLGSATHALEVTARIEQVVRRSGNRHLLLDLVNVIGMALFEEGRIPDAEDRFEALLEHATAWENDDFAARASNNLGILASIRGRNDEALLSYKRALVAYQKLGSMRGLAQTHHNMGICYRDLGYQAEADRHFERAISLARDDGSPDVVATAESERAMLRVQWGDPALARVMAGRAIQSFERMADPLGRADALRVLAAASRADGDPTAA
ncbi:MAG TPA: tetratricopeptide repeat protein, partial [Longimicrobiaceae bacterium]|nr:tetratricopeptide repeat protein [Longimicrobiaceae bacterium]